LVLPANPISVLTIFAKAVEKRLRAATSASSNFAKSSIAFLVKLILIPVLPNVAILNKSLSVKETTLFT